MNNLYKRLGRRKDAWGAQLKRHISQASQAILQLFSFFLAFSIVNMKSDAAGPAFFRLQPQKRTYHLHIFLTYHVYKSREGIICRTNLAD